MQIPKQQRNEIINGLLPLLIPAVEQTQRIRKLSGMTLIKEGVTTDVKGKAIKPAIIYTLKDTVQIPVNHKRRMLEVIDRAKTLEDMQEDLSRYLAKFAKSKETISDSIKEQQ